MATSGHGPTGGRRTPEGGPGLFRVVGLIFLILGLALGILFAVLAVRASALDGTRPTVQGTVVGNHEEIDRSRDRDRNGRENRPLYYPVIDYVVDGKTYTLTASSGSRPPKYAVGDKVEISYDPDNPVDAQIAGSSFVLFVILAAGFAVVMGGLGAVLLIVGKKLQGKGGPPAARGPTASTIPPYGSGLTTAAQHGADGAASPPQRRPGPPIVVPIALIIAGLVVTAIVSVVLVRGQQFEDRAIRVPGVVTELENDQGSFRPVVTYTLDGRERTFTASVASNPPAYEIGEKVTVLIDPVNRYDVKIQGQGSVVGVVFLSLGIALLVAGAIVLLITLRRRGRRVT